MVKWLTVGMPIPKTRTKIDLPVDDALLEPCFNLKVVLGWPTTMGILDVTEPRGSIRYRLVVKRVHATKIIDELDHSEQ